MKIHLVMETVDLGFHVHACFVDREKAAAHRQWLADSDSLVQHRKAAGDPYFDRYSIQEMEIYE